MGERGPPGPRVVVLGASAGGVEALRIIAAQLPADFPCPILTVLHIGRHESILPQLLIKAGGLGASHAVDGEPIRAGHFHVAPPDRHLLVNGERILLSSGPKEHHARPAIDPLMRSAALELGPRVVGVVLTGHGEDGTPGLQAIKSHGGRTVVQDPETARYPAMPGTALRYVKPHLCVPLEQIASTLVEVAREPLTVQAAGSPSAFEYEHNLFLAKGDPLENLKAVAKPSTFVCPDCKGALWEVKESRPVRFRCHTGHAYTLGSLQRAQAEDSDTALWGAIRALQEEELLLRRMAEDARAESSGREAMRLLSAAERIADQAARLRAIVEELPQEL
jgi:two-component system, chemotaxis family, protein-glutamate methylesterase/glutaminase